jgi:hypothetical protein
MAGLKDIPDDLKIKAFNLIVEKYAKDSDLSGFGKEVQTILINLRELYK